MKNNYVIGISGESGVGKSTISKLISIFFGITETTNLSTDDLHKWDRKSDMWNTTTHYNPLSNNLELGDTHLKYLKKDKPIFRSIYNHTTGYFNPPIKIVPKKIIIIDGLHAFHSEYSKNNIDLKIYIDTDEELMFHWKIMRDTEERGYKYNTVLDNMNKRKKDAHFIREEQMKCADVIISIKPSKKIKNLGDKHENIEIKFDFTFLSENVNLDLFNFIKNYNYEFSIFTEKSEILGNDLIFCQNGGGNTSTKIDSEFMFIKASGYSMKNMKDLKGFTLVNHEEIIKSLNTGLIKNDDDLNNLIIESTVSDKIPSMETGFHVLLNKYVIHLHPIYLTTLLSLENSKEIIKSLFDKYDYEYIDYVNPGFELYKSINESINKDGYIKKIFFLENHGIILNGDNINYLMEILYDINEISKKYINNLGIPDFNINSNIINNGLFTFPDAAIFLGDNSKQEIFAFHSYILNYGDKISKIKYLDQNKLNDLKNTKSEKHRREI